jgi:hypothetical protein
VLALNSRDLEDLVGGGIEGEGAAGEAGDVEFLIGRVRANDTTGGGGFFADEELAVRAMGAGCGGLLRWSGWLGRGGQFGGVRAWERVVQASDGVGGRGGLVVKRGR